MAVFVLRWSGNFLVLDDRRPSDVILVLAGDANDARLKRGMELLSQGWGSSLLVDAEADWNMFGLTPADMAQQWRGRLPPDVAMKVRICPVTGDSTVRESLSTGECLSRIHVHSVLIVTSNFHSRRARNILSTVLPQYSWTATPITDTGEFQYDPHWWRRRAWAKTWALEWQKWLWWQGVERWRR